jgi:hypothetical protein
MIDHGCSPRERHQTEAACNSEAPINKCRLLLIFTLTVTRQSICKTGEEHEIRDQLVRTPARFALRV